MRHGLTTRAQDVNLQETGTLHTRTYTRVLSLDVANTQILILDPAPRGLLFVPTTTKVARNGRKEVAQHHGYFDTVGSQLFASP